MENHIMKKEYQFPQSEELAFALEQSILSQQIGGPGVEDGDPEDEDW